MIHLFSFFEIYNTNINIFTSTSFTSIIYIYKIINHIPILTKFHLPNYIYKIIKSNL